MAYSTPRTWASGEHPTAAQFNANIRDNISFLANPPACRVYHNTTQSIADATVVAAAFNSERYDTDTMHDTATNNTRVTIKTAGIYTLTFHGEFPAAADYSTFYCDFYLNGATSIAVMRWHPSAFNDTQDVNLATVYKFAVNDYVETRVYQDNTANAARNLLSGANYSPEFAVTWIGLG